MIFANPTHGADVATSSAEAADIAAVMAYGSQNAILASWSTDKVAAYYSSYAQTYDRDIDNDPDSYPAPFVVGSWIADALTQQGKLGAVHSQHKHSNGVTDNDICVLDMGCGTGQSSAVFFRHAQGYCFKVHGVDTTIEMLELARRRPFHRLLCHDIQQPLPYAPGSFDVAVCIGVMDFVVEPRQLLDRLAILLKSGDGMLGITFPERHPTSTLNAWSREQIEEMLTAPSSSTMVKSSLTDDSHEIQHTGWRIERHQHLLGYRDSENGDVTYYHAYLLRRQ